MRIIYLVGSIISFVVILVLAFENIQASCNYLTFFFWEVSSGLAPTFILFGAAMAGIVTGGFLTLLVTSIMETPDEDEEDENFDA